MRKFIVKLSVFIFIVSLIILAINTRYLSVMQSGEKSYSNSSVEKFNLVPKGIEVCNFGSSHGSNDFYYDNLISEYVCFNFALPSQTLDYDYRILDYYKNNISEDAIVFITISYMSFYGIDEVLRDNFLSKNNRYYKFLPKEYIKEYDLKIDILETKFPSLVQYENLVGNLIGNQSSSKDEENNIVTQNNINKYAEETYYRHIIEGRLDENGNRIVNESYIKSLYNMIELCKSNGATPILVTTPFLSEYTDKIKSNSPEFFGEFYNQINDIIANTDIKYLDYGFDERFCNDYSLFLDADHLNRSGALKFVDVLWEDVKKMNSMER